MRGKKHSIELRAILTIFTVTMLVTSTWAATEKKLHSFGLYGKDALQPFAGLIMDPAGNLYGTTYYGGDYGDGTVFELSPNGRGGWTEKKLHNFGLYSTDGAGPEAGLIFDTAGNLYGTTLRGGTHNYGTVFELRPTADGGWTEKRLCDFGTSKTDGVWPESSLSFDIAGNLYGTTSAGGAYSGGNVFELMPAGGGAGRRKRCTISAFIAPTGLSQPQA